MPDFFLLLADKLIVRKTDHFINVDCKVITLPVDNFLRSSRNLRF